MKFCLRKGFLLLLLILSAGLLISAASGEEFFANLIYNGDFELEDEEFAGPEGWDEEEYFSGRSYTEFRIIRDDDERGSVAFIQNFEKNDSRYVQYVDVEPDTVYRLSGYIRTENVTDGRGANLSIEGLYAFSDSVYGTHDWQYIEYYGETGPDQTYVGVYARLGGYGGESAGKAWFDDIRLEAVDEVPDQIIAARWYAVSSAGSDDDDWDDDDDSGDESDGQKTDPLVPAWLVLTVIGLCWAVVLAGVIYYYRDGRRQPGYLFPGKSSPRLPFLMLAFLLRLIISFLVEGYDVDVVCFTSWGNTMAFFGPTRFYQSAGMIDYPPLYTYILGINSRLAADLHASAAGTNLIFRFVPCLCDVLFCYVLYRYAVKKHPESAHFASVILIMTALNPAMILNSAAWGQIDSVLSLMLVLVAVLAIEKKWHIAIPVYALSVLVKPQALMLGFLGLAYIIMTYIREPECRKSIWQGVAAGILAMAVVIIPFGLSQDYGWLIKLYENTLKSYPHATVNCANLYYLLGGNWDAIENEAHVLAPVFLLVVSLAYAVLWYLFHRERKLAWFESAASLLFACWSVYLILARSTWGDVGIAAMAFPFLITISLAVRKKDIRFLPYLGGLLFILLYVFGVKMHERYLFPGLFLLFSAWIVLRDRRILYISLLFTLTLFVNEGIILDNSIRFGRYYGHLMPDTVEIADVICVLNIIGAVLATLLGFSILSGRTPGEVKPLPAFLPVRKRKTGRSPLEYHPDRKLHWNWKDTLILSLIVAVYSVVTLTTLGSTKAPQTVWTSSGYDETVVFDLGEDHEDIRVLYFGQVNYHDIAFAQSDDGVHWSEDVYGKLDQGQCWKWRYVTQSYEYGDSRTFYDQNVLHFSCRYIRLTADQYGLALNEILFRNEKGETVSATIVSHEGGNPDSALYSEPDTLLDEQDTMEGLPALFSESEKEAQPSWWNSTYFDEIYHARTGFEFVESTRPYETSHPPLGKILISWSIRVFGMTPFGWRFAGALAGILMLLGMYLLGKQLTKKTAVAAMVTLLMALDCMHLTQTQIATIDSYPVLFIIFAFFFMLRFIQTDIIREPLRKSLWPLFFSGVFMGFAIASKWIGIYAGAGLAVLFFWHFFRTKRLVREAEGMAALNMTDEEGEKELHPYITCGTIPGYNIPIRLMWICLWCLLFFIAVPVVIYLLSYIPYFAYSTKIHTLKEFVDAVWKEQIGMYNYHSTPGLGMDHPFYSPWYEWPLIRKPMYYANQLYPSVSTDLHYSIFSLGNPVIWWGALAALPVCLFRWMKSKHYQIGNSHDRWHLTNHTYGVGISFMLIGLMAQFFPWVPVPRGTYIYHYFASIPFLILAVGLCFDGYSKKGKVYRWTAGAVICAAALVFFIIFFPYASGMPVSAGWLNIGKAILHVYY